MKPGEKLISLSMGLLNPLDHYIPIYTGDIANTKLVYAGELGVLGNCFQFYSGVKLYTFGCQNCLS